MDTGNRGNGVSLLNPSSEEPDPFVSPPKIDNRIFCFDEDQTDPSIDKKNGNICLDIYKKPDLRFHLTGPGSNQWEFVGIQLSGDNQDWPGKLPLGTYSDFQFGSDAALQAGKPHVNINGAQMHVPNNNCHAFKVYYRVLLRRPAQQDNVPDDYYYLHPMMDNRGSNN